jgi:hypothetical protein
MVSICYWMTALHIVLVEQIPYLQLIARVLHRCDASKSPTSRNGDPGGYAGASGRTPPEGKWEESFVLRSVPSVGTTFVLNGDGRIAESLWSNGAWSWEMEEDRK